MGTRGMWKHNEMAWAVLAVLDVSKRSGYPPLRLKAIQKMTGANYGALVNSLPKWVGWRWIKRHPPRHVQYSVIPVYVYSITGKGKRRMLRMEYPRQSGFTFKPGVDRAAMLERLPFFKEYKNT